jgi:hypothetical protein
MRTSMRLLALLAGMLAISGAATEAASASIEDQVHASASIKGAGSISGPSSGGRSGPGMLSCEQAPPVDEASVKSCSPSWRLWKNTVGDINLPLTADAATGWRFSHWTGCTSVSGKTCTLQGLAGRGIMQYSPQAVFTDEDPEGVADLAAVPDSIEGSYRITWTTKESGLIFYCSIDGGASQRCRSGLLTVLPEGQHTVDVFAKDSNGHAGPVKSVRFTRVDTALTIAPAELAEVRAAAFAATSRAGREFECSIDGGPFAGCGSANPGEQASLRLPAVADGRHTVQVRARYRDFVDLVPAARTWIVDTTAPETTVRATATGFELRSDESGVTFRCRIDHSPFGPCDASHPVGSLGIGAHTFEAVATDRVGNVDATPATHSWTIAPPMPASAPMVAEPTPVIVTTAPQRLSFNLRYATRKGRLIRLTVTDLAPRADLRVSVKCPKRTRCPKGFAKWNALGTVQLKRLVGQRLPSSAKITVRARRGTETVSRTIDPRKG